MGRQFRANKAKEAQLSASIQNYGKLLSLKKYFVKSSIQ